jgi:hypothetical protein
VINQEPKQVINIYCDESCHLEHDKQTAMVFGCIWAPKEIVPEMSIRLKELKADYRTAGELKWTKVSPKNLGFYLSLVDWFFAEKEIHFRTLVIPNKGALDHGTYNHGSHDEFYYKMYFSLLNKVLSPDKAYNIYLDVKDTRSRFKVRKLREVLCLDKYDFTGQMIQQIRSIRSHDAQLLQIADFLLGAVSYRHRFLDSSEAKKSVVARIEHHLKRDLLQKTSLYEKKFNVFIWQPRGSATLCHRIVFRRLNILIIIGAIGVLY